MSCSVEDLGGGYVSVCCLILEIFFVYLENVHNKIRKITNSKLRMAILTMLRRYGYVYIYINIKILIEKVLADVN